VCVGCVGCVDMQVRGIVIFALEHCVHHLPEGFASLASAVFHVAVEDAEQSYTSPLSCHGVPRDNAEGTHDRKEKLMPCRRWASENPREDSRATVRCGHRPRIRREPWSIVDSKTPASSRRFISLSVASLRTYYVPVSWKAVHHSRRWHRARAIQ